MQAELGVITAPKRRTRWFISPVHTLPCPHPQEYADFVKQVEAESAAAAAQQAADEEAEAAGRVAREDFEQL